MRLLKPADELILPSIGAEMVQSIKNPGTEVPGMPDFTGRSGAT